MNLFKKKIRVLNVLENIINVLFLIFFILILYFYKLVMIKCCIFM